MRKTLIIAGVAALVAVAPVAADVFTVTMKSGATFQSRYQPNQSDTDENKILLLTGFGNWISLPKAEIAGITSETDAVKIELELNPMVPAMERGEFSLRMILHGRRVCIARRPRCEECVLNDFCPSSRV